VAVPIVWIPKEGVRCILLETDKVLLSPRLEAGMDGTLIKGWQRVKRYWGVYASRRMLRAQGSYRATHPNLLLEAPDGQWIDHTYRVYMPNLDMTYSMELRDLGGKKGETPWWEFRSRKAIEGVKFEVLEPTARGIYHETVEALPPEERFRTEYEIGAGDQLHPPELQLPLERRRRGFKR